MTPWFYHRWGAMRRGGYGVSFRPANAIGVLWIIVIVAGVVGGFWIPTDHPISVNDGAYEGNVLASGLILGAGFAVAYSFSEPESSGGDES